MAHLVKHLLHNHQNVNFIPKKKPLNLGDSGVTWVVYEATGSWTKFLL